MNNDRIKTMWEESTGSMWPRPGEFTAGEYDTHLAKFAELIVQECMKSVAETPFGYKDYRSQIEEDMRNACVDEIKQHFGVE